MEKQYEIYDFGREAIDWHQIEAIQIDCFPWYKKGDKQMTTVKCAIERDIFHMKVYAEDCHIRSDVYENNTPVYEDSCFEWFVTPTAKKGESYFNIEISCNGTIYMAYRDNTSGKIMAPKEVQDSIKIQSDIGRDHWTLEIGIPIWVFESMGKEPADKSFWYGNFYRCGGKEDDQYACWQPIEAPVPNFHVPDQFGKLILRKV
ncbi:MAG: hypothetical protein K0R69_2519 [Clostridia bacterium]|jgi:hypothetical protein|nr:hypothetical protein [Clostridia bacterium]